MARKNLLDKFLKLEAQNKQRVSRVTTWQLQRAYCKLRLIDAQNIAPDILYAKERAFEYKDKAGKQLAWVLSELPTKWGTTSLKFEKGEVMKDVMKKLEIFVNYFQEL